MRKVGWIVFGMTLLLTACSGNGSAPATAPPTSAVVATVTPTTTPPPTTNATTTTTSTVDRVSEIEEILLDLLTRSMAAQVERDEGAFRSVFANPGFEERSMEAFDEDLFQTMPIEVSVDLVELLVDGGSCIAARNLVTVDGQVGNGGEPLTTVLELQPSGRWGLSFIGEGWACDGPHPFSDS